MFKSTTVIKNKLINLIQTIDNESWFYCDIYIQFPPTINKGFKTKQFFFNTNNEKVDTFFWPDKELEDILYSYIFIINQNENINQIKLNYRKAEEENASLSVSFNQEIEDTFQNNLPKSKRGKTLPWWKIESETQGLGL
jgi:hypothetical protein